MNVPMVNVDGHAEPVIGGYMIPPAVSQALIEGKIDAKEFNRIVGGPCIEEPDDMVGVREYGDGLPVKCVKDENDRDTIVALNEVGHCATHVDLVDVLKWVRDNRPELLLSLGLGRVE
jgi:hypothetical protein